MRRDTDYHFDRLLETFAGPDVLPTVARRGLVAQIMAGWDVAPPCATADPAAWFPPILAKPAAGVSVVCASCPVSRSCLATAILDDEYGIWGGTRRGQRLHARARLLNGDDVADVLSELSAMPIPDTEYGIHGGPPTDETNPPLIEDVPAKGEWRAAS